MIKLIINLFWNFILMDSKIKDLIVKYVEKSSDKQDEEMIDD